MYVKIIQLIQKPGIKLTSLLHKCHSKVYNMVLHQNSFNSSYDVTPQLTQGGEESGGECIHFLTQMCHSLDLGTNG